MTVPLSRVVPSLRERAVDAVEIMDHPDSDPELLRRTYAQFRYINAVVSGWRTTYRRDIRPLLSARRPSTLLDIGSGGGDVSRALALWAARDGLLLSVTAIDPDERAHDFAINQPPVRGLTFRRALSSELVAEGARFDLVVSNHVLHHLTAHELGGLLFDSEYLVRGGGWVLHADIERSLPAYIGFGAATWPFFHGSFIRADGLTSIRRSYTAAELEAAVPPGWWVTREIPSRLLLRFDAPRTSPATNGGEPGAAERRPHFGPGAAGPQSGLAGASGSPDA